MAVFEQDGAAALWCSGFWWSLPQQYPLTPGGPEQDLTGIFSDEQRAVIAGTAPMLGEEAGDLLLRLAAEVLYRGWPLKYRGWPPPADAQNAVLHQLARLREEAAVREQEEGVGGAASGSRPGANAGDVQVTTLAVCRRSGSLQKLLRSRHLAAQQAVSRSLGDVDEVIEGGDPAEIADLHEQLQKRQETLTETAIQLGDEQLNAITKLQIIVDRTLRRLSRRRRELIRATDTGSLFSPSPSERGDNGSGGEIEQPPSNQVCHPSGLVERLPEHEQLPEVEQLPEHEQLPEEEQQPEMVEDVIAL
jgi:hypothetical protein